MPFTIRDPARQHMFSMACTIINRNLAAVPQPTPPGFNTWRDAYMRCLDVDEIRAMHTLLHARKHMLVHSLTGAIRLDATGCRDLIVSFGKNRPCSAAVMPMSVSHPLFGEVYKFAVEAERVTQGQRLARNLVTEVIGQINTSGQLLRLAPELVRTLPQYLKDDIENNPYKQSAKPKDWTDDLEEAYKSSVLPWLARGSLLPDSNEIPVWRLKN